MCFKIRKPNIFIKYVSKPEADVQQRRGFLGGREVVTPGSTEEAEARGSGVKVEVKLPLDVTKEVEAGEQRKTVTRHSVSQGTQHS